MWTLTADKSWQSLQQFNWVNDMNGIPQNPVHHAEGDVAMHTQMVLTQLIKLPEYIALAPQEKEILWAAALLHDVEKRSTTTSDENGDIVAPGHAEKSATTARQILYRDIDTPFHIREEIVGLVKYHGLPRKVLDMPNPVKALLQASLEVNTMWLAILATADVLGRTCADKEELLFQIDLFKEFCLEHDCWGKPFAFASRLAKFNYFRKEDESPLYEPFDNTRTQAIIMAGIAGAGKDCYIQQHYPNHLVISPDTMRREQKIRPKDGKENGRIIQETKDMAKAYLQSQRPFIWNATNITLQMREQLINVFADYLPIITIVYVEVPYQQLLAQNREREFAFADTAIEKMINSLEVPKQWEAHEVKYVTLIPGPSPRGEKGDVGNGREIEGG